MKLKRGSTSVRRLIFVADSSSTTGAGLASLVYNSGGLVAYYIAGDLSNEVQITLATATLGTWASGGFVAVDNTNMPGWYEIGIPDAALDGGNEVAIQLRGAADMVPVNIYIELDAFDYQTATQPVNVTQISGDSTAADNAESFFDGTGYAGTNNVIPVVTTLTNLPAITANWLTAAGLATDAVTEIQSGLATASALSTVAGYLDTEIAAILADTNELQTDWANGGRLDNILDARASQASVDTVDTVVDSILVDTNELQTDWVNGGRLDLILDARASQASVDTVDTVVDSILVAVGDVPTNAELATALGTADDAVLAAVGTVDTVVDAIKAKTDQLVFTIAGQVDANALSGGGGLDAAGVRAAVGLTSANLDTQLSTIDTVVDTILVDTNELQTDWVNGGRLDLILDARASQTSVDTIDGIVDAILVDTGTTLQAELDGIQADTEDIQARLPAALVSGRMDASVGAMDANVMTASALATDAVTEIQSGLATAASLATVAGYLDTEIAAILADTNELQTDWANGGRLDLILDARASQTSVDTVDTVVDSILVDTAVIGAAGAGLTAIPWNVSWDAEVQSECADALTAYDPPTRAELTTDTNSILTAVGDVPTNAELATALGTADDAVLAAVGTVDTVVDAIKAKTDQLVFTIAGQVDANALSGGGGLDAAGVRAAVGLTSANLDTQLSTIDTVVDTILVDTNELQTDWVNGGRLDLILDARASQTSVDTIDTVVDSILVDTAVIGAAGAGLTAIPWNAAWDTEVQSECADALTAYDPPTRAELTTDTNSILTAVGDVPTNAELATALASADDAVLAAVATVDSIVDAIKVTTDKVDDTLEDDAGTYRFTTNALEQAPSGGGSITVQDIVDGILDETLADHLDSGSVGAGINAASSAGDPWATALPGAYGSGSAGQIIGDNLNATISSRASQTSVDTVAGYLDTEVAAIKAKTDNLPSDPADASDIAAAFVTVNSKLDTIDAVVDAILVDTGTTLQSELDGIQADTEDIQSRIPLALVSGRMDSSIGAAAANTINASALATDAVTEIQSGLATAANLATVAGYLDTEIAAIVTSTGTTIPAQIAALNNLSSGQVVAALGTGSWASAIPWNAAWDAEVQSECTDALNAYDPPTRAELTTDTNSVLTAVGDVPTNAELATALSAADDAVLAAVGTVDTVVDAIKARTDNLPTDPADQSAIETAITNSQTAIITQVDANETKIDALVSAVSSIPTASQNATQVATELATTITEVGVIHTIMSGITSLGDWLRRIARKDAGSAGMITAETEINTGGTSTFVGTTDNLEAIKDAGGSGGGGEADWTETEREQIRYRLGLDGDNSAPVGVTPDPIVVTPGTGNSTTGYYTVLDKNLDPEPGVTVYAKMLDAYDTDTGFIYSGEVLTSVSNAYGVCEFTMIKGASYRCWRTSPTPTAPISLIVVPLDAGTTTPLKSLVRI